MNSAIDLINTVYIALALFIGVASVVVVFIYIKDSRAKAIEKVYGDNFTNTVHIAIAGLRKETRISIWLSFCTNIGMCLLISTLAFKGLD
jgi:uncharacterized PurR-regulated membrane protein YhhQ (DUF165 family)